MVDSGARKVITSRMGGRVVVGGRGWRMNDSMHLSSDCEEEWLLYRGSCLVGVADGQDFVADVALKADSVCADRGLDCNRYQWYDVFVSNADNGVDKFSLLAHIQSHFDSLFGKGSLPFAEATFAVIENAVGHNRAEVHIVSRGSLASYEAKKMIIFFGFLPVCGTC